MLSHSGDSNLLGKTRTPTATVDQAGRMGSGCGKRADHDHRFQLWRLDYEQRDFVTKAGWATVPGNPDPNRDVAEACATALLKTASK